MGFIKYMPIGKKKSVDLFTTNSPEKQIWQEIVMIRHLKKPKGINAKLAMAPWLDQAKVYFLDAYKSDWKSAGLLYYYSFLNLAKAYLAAKRAITAKKMKSSNIFHGLSAKPQSPGKITDFEINIHPPVVNNKDNIFAAFYEKLLNHSWPHDQTITIKTEDVLPYCCDISSEIRNFYEINCNVIYIQSLLREAGGHIWLELLVPENKVAVIQENIQNINFSIHSVDDLDARDRTDWLTSYERTLQSFDGYIFLRSQTYPHTAENRQEVFQRFYRLMENSFNGYIQEIPVAGQKNSFWQFIPKITLSDISMLWHPILSDYLFAFVMSTILRYHPHLLSINAKDSFFAEAWCSQSAITTLRYFLMSLTVPPLRLN